MVSKMTFAYIIPKGKVQNIKFFKNIADPTLVTFQVNMVNKKISYGLLF